jgi:hypothetical protein
VARKAGGLRQDRGMHTLRLRQAVVAAADRDAVVAAWHRLLGLGTPFADPGVATFGLHNAVVPVGDSFLEVVSPLVPGDGCPAERYMAARGGDCGYMAIFQVGGMDAARAHLAGLGLRTVFEVDLDDIRCTHVHPADLGAAIVSFDEAAPPASWRWAGPDWEHQVRTDVVTGLAGIRLTSSDPGRLLARWAAALAVEPAGDALRLPDGTYVEVAEGADERLAGIDLRAAPGVDPREHAMAGTAFRIVPG